MNKKRNHYFYKLRVAIKLCLILQLYLKLKKNCIYK